MNMWRFLALSLSPVVIAVVTAVAFGFLRRAPASPSVCDRADMLVQELPVRIQTCRTDSCVEWYIKQSQKWDAECHDAGTVEQ
jgi:hypothetical protein